ncbi:dTDP-4-dehydrorhamnose reductase [Photobacterium aphoticum]|uniref:dTDP-4-dehydrorhamnose reductase n=1 Tax=Photobacterium aphoticum TaxID=754436 RepID=A0A0J1GF63_9GAMM|nr:dTDP-4-dehydrorhamnose reductase [Photobacterium aphoticum]KLU98347.1 dTDP-4-dehydrorhamnose reductase [Photobacterium aphoticum]KLU98878.1 dTDP-4-dehydrorhamnose reductase [Photobacterium aphoticum]GHA38968.1 NAD(P)-dependent oxidoreductase [Photobacterium aphoticum]
MRVLVTGAKGQVGCSLVERLSGKVELLAIDRDELDITNENAVFEAVKAFEPDIIINAAAHTAVDKAEEEVELSYAINRDGPLYLAQAAESIGAALLHISTDYVFSGDKNGIYIETDAVDPKCVYGKSKLLGEQAVLANCSRTIILRTAWVFGEDGNNFVKTILRLAQQRDELGIVADQFGGPTYAGDIATALITIAKTIVAEDSDFDTTKYGIYHYSGLPHTSWCGFAQTIIAKAVEQKVLNKAPIINGIKTDDYPTPAKRPANSKLNTQKITETFGIQASDWQYALNQLSDY